MGTQRDEDDETVQPAPDQGPETPQDQPTGAVDDGEVPDKQIQRWKNEGGAYLVPPE